MKFTEPELRCMPRHGGGPNQVIARVCGWCTTRTGRRGVGYITRCEKETETVLISPICHLVLKKN
jgi:hypothetical protein